MKKIMKLSFLISLFAIIVFSSCVKNEVTKITLNKSTSNLIIGQTDSLTANITTNGEIKSLQQTWTSSNSTVATVTDGTVTAIRSGTAIITVKAGAKTATCEVTVVDKILPSLAQGELWYYGDVYKTNSSNNFVLYLASSVFNMDGPKIIGELLIVELNTALTVKDSIPSGVYEMMTENDLSKATPLTLVPAFIDSSSGSPWGCWYFGIITDPVSLGNIVVSRKNNIYTINYDLFDDYGVEISGTYKGSINYFDGTVQTAQASIKNKVKLKPDGIKVKTMKFQKR